MKIRNVTVAFLSILCWIHAVPGGENVEFKSV